LGDKHDCPYFPNRALYGHSIEIPKYLDFEVGNADELLEQVLGHDVGEA
jgi:hypothetical protein